MNLHSGVLSDGAVRLVARGRRAITSEVVGSGGLFDFVRRNPSVQLHPCTYTHDPALLASLPHFVTVNSALEVDLTGQVNAESLNGEVVSGVGGSLDFVEGARRSRSGLVVVALPSTTADGRGSRIVPTLSRGAVVTIPRSCVDTVVTEYGVADLRGKDLRERADALLQVAHPDFREVLRRKCFP
ncbi:MAG: acetyl-CoA hydrolase/transferase C-terminal domain-containing protein [Armatimonadota bacterium]|nr:acetyl-CoA hydrolase/transferase C-terminal domain-containing protein [Armatimonadota bacterium]MDR7469491.1 acetyl-CoA hydrolase/transferase C-terminal domain-containing protein [Armatimonadota bacterium]MDR7475442.1 acetyl-CoA hydrolase/transferase C-terminal domain-containing protein [Armatimonadota bacterium]